MPASASHVRGTCLTKRLRSHVWAHDGIHLHKHFTTWEGIQGWPALDDTWPVTSRRHGVSIRSEPGAATYIHTPLHIATMGTLDSFKLSDNRNIWDATFIRSIRSTFKLIMHSNLVSSIFTIKSDDVKLTFLHSRIRSTRAFSTHTLCAR